jgi:hypothetical protein
MGFSPSSSKSFSSFMKIQHVKASTVADEHLHLYSEDGRETRLHVITNNPPNGYRLDHAADHREQQQWHTMDTHPTTYEDLTFADDVDLFPVLNVQMTLIKQDPLQLHVENIT